jgi:hypothetical protein
LVLSAPSYGAEGALFERMTEAEELFGMGAELIANPRAEIGGTGPGGEPGECEYTDET